ncbi:substrate-binding domain-containing protein [Tomitella fengzijianii]|uniref:substrate-binding domain-containing protein n=2 Tax=Tomitella fengzijianii TaxID=2597660 RepID=UPI003557EB17
MLIGAIWGAVARQGSGAGGQVRIAMSLSTLNNPFFVGVRDGAQREAAAQGVELSVTDAGSDATRQANDVQNAIARSSDVIIVNPVDSDAVVPSVSAASAAGIPVIALDRAPSGGVVVTTVASDNVEGGRLAAQQLARVVGSGPVVVLEGTPGTSAARERSEGFDSEIAKFPQIQVVARQPADFDRTKALNVMSNLLQAHPDVRGVFAANDEMALGAVKALGGRAGTDVKVVGFDGTPQGLAAVEGGTINADVAQQPEELGAEAIWQAVAAAGEEPPEESGAPHKVPPCAWSPGTRDHRGSAAGRRWSAAPPAQGGQGPARRGQGPAPFGDKRHRGRLRSRRTRVPLMEALADLVGGVGAPGPFRSDDQHARRHDAGRARQP